MPAAQSPRSKKLAAALSDPRGVFNTPDDVLREAKLSREAKLLILHQWEHDARGLAVAEEEGMTGGEESLLSRVRRAIAALGGPTPISSAYTKHGG